MNYNAWYRHGIDRFTQIWVNIIIGHLGIRNLQNLCRTICDILDHRVCQTSHAPGLQMCSCIPDELYQITAGQLRWKVQMCQSEYLRYNLIDNAGYRYEYEPTLRNPDVTTNVKSHAEKSKTKSFLYIGGKPSPFYTKLRLANASFPFLCYHTVTHGQRSIL